MLDLSKLKHVYLFCGYTDMRKGIDGLAAIVQEQYEINVYQEAAIFLFCGRRTDRYKALLFDHDGFLLLYKRIDNGRLRWPRKAEEVRPLSQRELQWLLEGLSIDQPHAIRPATTGGAF